MSIPSFAIPVKRGCGTRVEGGIYLVTTAEIEELWDYIDVTEDTGIGGKLVLFPKPYPFMATLKPFRGYRGFDKKRFFNDLPNVNNERIRLKNCYYAKPEEQRAWLHWIGNKYYTIKSFIEEARLAGVSRRVPKQALRKMRWGDSIFLTSKEKGLKTPVVFGYFRLEKIEGVKVRREEMPEQLQDKVRYEEKEF